MLHPEDGRRTGPPERGSPELESILEEARKRSGGLENFGDESFREPLAVLLESLEREAHLSAAGRVVQRERIVELLVNRLRVEQRIARHPEILEERVERPVVIVGLPRTGTTMLHRMLGCDRRLYAPLWFETRIPAAYPDWDFASPDPRIPVAEAEVQAMLEGNPDLAAMHPLVATEPDEDIMLLEHSFYSTTPPAFAEVPSYSRWLVEHDNHPGYHYLERLLQLLQWQRRRSGHMAERWVLKAPHHMHCMAVLFDVFPDVRVIQTHRDPIQTIPSIASFEYALHQLGCNDVDAARVGAETASRYARGISHSMEVRERHPEQFLDIHYEDTVKEPWVVLERIYAFIGMELGDEARAAMQRWRDANPRERRPPHRYTLAQFGYTEEGLAEQFRRYRERFILGQEAVGG